jgi:hypothetical protein
VGDAADRAVEGAVGEPEARVRVPGAHGHPAARGLLDQVGGPRELRRERYHPHGTKVEQPGEQPRVRARDVGGGVRPPLVQVEEGSFEVDAEHLGPVRGTAGDGVYGGQRLFVEALGEEITVGRYAVVPVLSRARESSARRSGSEATSTPKAPLTCRSTKPGRIRDSGYS